MPEHPERIEIPLFPLGTVLLPGAQLPLRVFEQRYVDMTKACLRDDSVFGVCLIRQGREAGPPALPFEVGCTARIVEWDVPAPGLFTLLVQGERVFRVMERSVAPSGLQRARVELRAPAGAAPVPDRHAHCVRLLRELLQKAGAPRFPGAVQLDDAGWVADRLAEFLPLPMRFRQQLLETPDAEARLAALDGWLPATPAPRDPR